MCANKINKKIASKCEKSTKRSTLMLDLKLFLLLVLKLIFWSLVEHMSLLDLVPLCRLQKQKDEIGVVHKDSL